MMPAVRARFATSLLLLAGCGGGVAASASDRTDGGTGPGDAAIGADGTVPGDAGVPGDARADVSPSGDGAVDSGVPLDAGPPPPPEVLVHSCQPTGIAVDDSGLYWATDSPKCGNPGIWRANLDGSGVTSLVGDFFATIWYPRDVVLYGDHVYWDNTGSAAPPYDPPISGCLKTGCNVGESIPTDAGTFTYASGLAVSDAGMFWAGNSGSHNTGSVWRLAPDDAGPSGPIVFGLFVPGGLALDGTSVYFGQWSNAGSVGAIDLRSPLLVLDGGATSLPPMTVLPVGDGGYSNLDFDPPSFAVDDTTLYFAYGAGSTVGSFPKNGLADGGATATVLAWNVAGPMHIVADDTNVYWTVRGPDSNPSGNPNVYNQGAVMKCAKTGCGAGGPTTMATGLDVLSGFLAVDAKYVYFTVYGDGTIQRVAK